MTNSNITYSEYIAENLDKSIAYSEYVAGNLDNSIAYTEYLAGSLYIDDRKNKRMETIKSLFNK